jgi:hypothetical protein
MLANLKGPSWKWFCSWKLSHYCFVLLIWILQKFRKWFDLVWIQYAKSKKEIRKQKIRKETAQKKGEKASPGWPEANQPNQARASPAARGPLPPPEPVPPLYFFPSLSYTWTPPVRLSSTLVLPAPETAADNSSWILPFPGIKSSNEASHINPQHSSSSYLFFPSLRSPQCIEIARRRRSNLPQ